MMMNIISQAQEITPSRIHGVMINISFYIRATMTLKIHGATMYLSFTEEVRL